MSKKMEYIEIARRLFRYTIGVAFWNITMFIVVSTLCFIALPKIYADALVCRISGDNCKVEVVKTSVDAIPLNSSQIREDRIETNGFSTIAKMVFDSSKEKYDTIKEVQDRLFSLIAALAALLTFLGFKGVESYFTTREKASVALASAEKYERFWKVQYPKNVRAEMAVVHGAALRDMADLYKALMHEVGKTELGDAYKESLYMAETILKSPVTHSKSDNPETTARALGTLANIYHRLGKFEQALETSREIYQTYIRDDVDAYFNCACYCSKIAEGLEKDGKIKEANGKLKESLSFCRKYLQLESDGIAAVSSLKEEEDLELLRTKMASDFNSLLELVKK